MVMSA